MLTSIVVSPINRVLRAESWACERLQAYSGKTVCVQVLPFYKLYLVIQSNGELQEIVKTAAADVTLIVSAMQIPGLMAKDTKAFDSIQITGDSVLASELIEIGKHIHIDFEQDLSQFVGDIPAHRIAQAGGQLVRWHARNFNSLTESLAEYWQEEQPVLAKSTGVYQFVDEVDALRTSVDQLDQRIQQLMQKAVP